MKKLLSLLLTVFLLASFAASTFAVSGGGTVGALDDGGLAIALTAAKSKFAIPAEYSVFTYNSNENNGKKVWQFNWSDGKARSVSISVDGAGRLLGYSSRTGAASGTKVSVPTITRAQAKKVAEDILKKAAPEVAGHLKEGSNGGVDTYSSAYIFEFDRYENGIPLVANGVSASVNFMTKELTALTITWEYDAVFPSPKGIIDTAAALKKWKDAQRVTLSYRLVDDKYDGSPVKAVLVYTADNNYLTVDAATGETFTQNYGWQQRYIESGQDNWAFMKSAAHYSGSFTPAELEKITDAEKLITAAKADQLLRANSYLAFDSSYTLTANSLRTDYSNRSRYVWDLTYGGSVTEGDFNPPYAQATVDAKTGELLSFYMSDQRQSAAKDIGQQAATGSAEAFLKATIPARFKNAVPDGDVQKNYPSPVQEVHPAIPLSYHFQYVRVNSKVKLSTDTISVSVNAETGKIISFHFNWHDSVTFESVDGILNSEQAIEKLGEQCGFLLQYELFTTYYYDKQSDVTSESQPSKIVPPGSTVPNSKTVRLIYSPDYNLPQSVFARSGVLAGNDGNPYVKKSSVISYSDLEKSSVKAQAELLADVGIGFDGGKLLPDKAVTQNEFLSLLKKTFVTSRIYYSSIAEQEEVDPYEEMLTKGIIDKSEVKPSAVMTKLDAFRFMIRAAGFKKAAELQGIYKAPFKDSGSIPEKDLGYCALAYGLGLAGETGSTLEPNKSLSRALTVALLYNYLKA